MRDICKYLVLGMLFVNSGCSSDPSAKDAEVGLDTSVADAVDVASDSADSSVPDGRSELTPDTADDKCRYDTIVFDEPDLNQKKFALSMFHFNIQYVPGGLTYIDDEGNKVLMCGDLCEGWDDDKLNDWYIEAVFMPVIDVFLKHPEWRATFEFQGLLLDVMAQRHPEALGKLAQVAQSGQLEVVSLHYSDQFFLAFPREDLQKSTDYNKQIFKDACIPLSPVVFNQEGQVGEGKHDFMADNGYTISVFPVNLWRYYHFGEERKLYYKDRGVDVVIGPGEGYRSDLPLVIEKDEETGIEVTWTFFDDGDLLAYPLSPYAAPLYTPEQGKENLSKYEAKLLDLESQGFRITTVSDYVAHLKANNVGQPQLPAPLDGTWQPIDTDSVHRWMGGRSMGAQTWHERDNMIRTTNYATRTVLAAAERLVTKAHGEGIDAGSWAEQLQAGWVHQFLAEVSDVTGITPWTGEFHYGKQQNKAAREAADQVIQGLLSELGWAHVSVDLMTDEVIELQGLPVDDAPMEVAGPFDLVVAAPTRETTVRWYGGDDLYRVVFAYGPSEDLEGKKEEKVKVTLGFPRYDDVFRYTPALLETLVVEYPFDLFSFQYPEVYLPLSNGLIGLGDGWWVIKDCRKVHVAARVPNGEGQKVIEFVDETADPAVPQTWEFVVLKGTPDQALEQATRLNTAPTVMF